MKLNARMKDSQEEVFLMSDQIVTELQEAVVEHIGELKYMSADRLRFVTPGCNSLSYNVSDAVSTSLALFPFRVIERNTWPQISKIDMLLSFGEISKSEPSR